MSDAVLLNGAVVDGIGMDIVTGRLAAGAVITLETVQERFGVSRTVARDSVHILETMQLVKAVRRHGLIVQPSTVWNVFDPQLIALRLRSPDRESQLTTLSQLRNAVEPQAASLAASMASDAERARLSELAGQIRAAGQAGDADRMMRADIEFHTLILRASGNDMLRGLTDVVTVVLESRAGLGVLPCPPAEAELVLHEAIARQIADGDSSGADESSRALLREVTQGA